MGTTGLSFLAGQRGDKKASRVSAVVTPEFMRSPAITMTPATPAEPANPLHSPAGGFRYCTAQSQHARSQATRRLFISKQAATPILLLITAAACRYYTSNLLSPPPILLYSDKENSMSGYGPGGSQVYTKPVPCVFKSLSKLCQDDHRLTS